MGGYIDRDVERGIFMKNCWDFRAVQIQACNGVEKGNICHGLECKI
jgi:hypothetical protein